MADPLKPVSEGDPVSAAAFNAMLASVRTSNEGAAELAAQLGENPLFWQRTIVQVKNSTGYDRMRFHVLGLSGPLYEPGSDTYKEFPRLVGTTPAKDSHEARFAVLQECTSEAAIGRAVVAGATVARVDMKAEAHEWADVADGTCEHLESRGDLAGAQILTVEAGIGVKWAIVRIGAPQGTPTPVYEITLEETGKKDTIDWDATVGAFYVWGKPVKEGETPMVIDGAAAVEKLWITAQYSDPEDRVDGLGSFAVGHRVYTAVRNGRREIVAPLFHDPRWEVIENHQGATILNGHALRVTGTGLLMNDGVNSDRVPLFDVKRGCDVYSPSATDWWQPARVPMINSPRSVGDQDLGRGTFACDRPFWAAIDPDLSSTLYAIGRPLGPAPGSWVLWPGLPGFVSLGSILADGDSVERLLVMRDTLSKCWWAKADGDWQANGISPCIYAHPCSAGHGSQCYDGTGDYDNIDMRVELPKMGSQEDPNLHDGDYFLYAVQAISDPSHSRGSPFVAYGDYLDGHLGEIRFMTGARPGWALADGTANSAGNGGTGRDLVTNNPYLRFNTTGGGTGGNTQHTHAAVVGMGLQSGADRQLQNATHLPPYFDLAPYERIP